MRPNRRKFLKYMLAGLGITTGLGSYWLATSQRRGARWLRQTIADGRRTILPAPVKPTPQQWSDNQVTLCWLGHATHAFGHLTQALEGRFQ